MFGKERARLAQDYFSKELRAMEIRFWQVDGLPADEVRAFGFVGALVEISPQRQREGQFRFSEDEGERYFEFYGPFEKSVFLFYFLTRESAFSFNERHLFRRKWLHLYISAEPARSHHRSDTIGFEIHVMIVSGHLAEELDT